MPRVRHGSRCPLNPVPVLPVMMASVERERASDVSRVIRGCVHRQQYVRRACITTADATRPSPPLGRTTRLVMTIVIITTDASSPRASRPWGFARAPTTE